MPRLISCMLAASVALSATRAAPYPRYYGHDVLDWPNDDRYSFRDSDYYHPSHHQRWQTHHHASDGYGRDSDPVLYEYIPRSSSGDMNMEIDPETKETPKSDTEKLWEARPSAVKDTDGSNPNCKAWARKYKNVKIEGPLARIRNAPPLRRKAGSTSK